MIPILLIGGLVLGSINTMNVMDLQNSLDDNRSKIELLTNDLNTLQSSTSSGLSSLSGKI